MTAPVDVLAVMEQAAREAVPLKFALEVDDARAAVAELVEAAKALESKSMQRTKLTASV